MVKKVFSDKFTFYLNHFEKSTIGIVKVRKDKRHSNYYYYARKIENILKNDDDSLVKWFNEEIESNSENPISNLLQRYERTLSLKQLENCYKTGFKKFAQSVIGIFYANTWLTIEDGQDRIFCELIAKNAIFASKEVVDKVKKGKLGSDLSKEMSNSSDYNNPYASWDYMVHYRDNKKAKERLENRMSEDFMTEFKHAPSYKIADSNNIANYALKQAILESYPFLKSFAVKCFKDYEVCHVWDKPADRRYYASIMNLVLVPRALAQLTDHNKEVMALLRRRAHDLFDFLPKGETKPKSKYYYSCEKLWREI